MHHKLRGVLVHPGDAVLGRRRVGRRVRVDVLCRPVMVAGWSHQHPRADDGGPAVVVLRVLPQPVQRDGVRRGRVEGGGHRDPRESRVHVDPHYGGVLRVLRPPRPVESPLLPPYPGVEPSLALPRHHPRHPHHAAHVHLHDARRALGPRAPEPDKGVHAPHHDGRRAVLAAHKVEGAYPLHRAQVDLDEPPRARGRPEDPVVIVPRPAQHLVLPGLEGEGADPGEVGEGQFDHLARGRVHGQYEVLLLNISEHGPHGLLPLLERHLIPALFPVATPPRLHLEHVDAHHGSGV
mmetsp:Transcript_38214/g.97705  ORF Transcript_38214/g.97705 Transcript_38214/m.97705 type:complete len:293 (-) Transcript_38214:547-1425(-)